LTPALLLAEEGLGWCVKDDDKAPAGHRLRIFADSPTFPEAIASRLGQSQLIDDPRPTAPGPMYSGEAPGKAGIAVSFAHGQGKPGKCNEHFGYDHQGSYGDEPKRSLYASMYAIIKIAQQAQWHRK